MRLVSTVLHFKEGLCLVFHWKCSRMLRGGNRFAGGSLETFAAILVRLQAKREDGILF